MSAQNFTTIITLPATAQHIYDCINNVKGWWHGEVAGPSNNPGDVFEYRMKQFHYSKQKVTELISAKRVVWDVIDSNLSFAEKPQEWTGTQIIFALTENDDNTTLQFTHAGLVPQLLCYRNCSSGWTQLIHESLYDFVKTGEGKAVFA